MCINKFSYLEPQEKPDKLVVFLHGFGSNKDDLITLSEEFKQVLPDALFVAPNAPKVCEICSFGYQWFSLEGVSLQDKIMDSQAIKKEIELSIKELNRFIDEILEENNIPHENLYLIGSSQGATMAICTALSRDIPVEAVLSYSGIVIDECIEIKSSPKTIGLIHGELDDVVPFFWHKDNLKILQKYDLNVKSLTIKNAYHEITHEAVEFGKELLCKKK